MNLFNRIEDFYKYFRQKKYLERDISDYSVLPETIFGELEALLVLSTGRSGTDLLARLFKLDRSNFVRHEPYPILAYGAKVAYETGPEAIEVRKAAFITARYPLVKESYLRHKRYVETNNKLSFFADAIYQLLSRSRFLHIVRDPRKFTRSGLLRRYYQEHDFDDRRIVPRPDSGLDWERFSDVQKVGWLWNETNRVIEEFKAAADPTRVMTVRSEELFTDPAVFATICRFMGTAEPNPKKIRKMLARPTNPQYKGTLKPFAQWSAEKQRQLRDITPLGVQYGYWEK